MSNDYFSPVELVEQAISADLDPESFALVDDRDFPRAANVVEFLMDDRFLGWSLFPRQIQIAMHTFMDFCPLCTPARWQEHLYDQPIEEILDRVVFLRYGVCPRCGLSRADLVRQGLFKGWINEVVGVAGQRSSKSYLTAMLSLYLLHRFLKLPTIPYRFFGLAPTLLHMTFVALTYGQAEDNLWEPFMEFYTASRWFKEYNEMLHDYELRLGIDRPLVEVKKSYICYRHKNLIVYPSGPDKRKLRGRTRFGYAIDEFAYFDSAPGSKSVKFNAEEIYAALDNSLATIRAAVLDKRKQGFYDIPDAYSFLISSPVSRQDKIMRMLRQADQVSSRYAFHYATWEFNPNIKFEHLKDKFEKDPVTARRDFGADPPLNDVPLISNLGVVKRMFHGPANLFQVQQIESGRYVETKVRFRRRPKNPTIIGIDAGLSGNSFAVVVLSLRSSGVYRVEGAFEVIPKDNKIVNFARLQNTLFLICEKLEPIAVYADRWNSITFLHALMDEQLVQEAAQLSLSYQDIKSVVGAIYDNTLKAPSLEHSVDWDDLLEASFTYPDYFINKPIAHLAYQLLTVRDLGRRVDKGLNATDDLFRAMCVAYIGFLHIQSVYQDFDFGEEDEADVSSPKALGVVQTFSSVSSNIIQTTRTNSPVGVVSWWNKNLPRR